MIVCMCLVFSGLGALIEKCGTLRDHLASAI